MRERARGRERNREGGFLMENYFKNMNTGVPSELILLLTHEFEKLSIH